jgi:hypothetical protein
VQNQPLQKEVDNTQKTSIAGIHCEVLINILQNMCLKHGKELFSLGYEYLMFYSVSNARSLIQTEMLRPIINYINYKETYLFVTATADSG